MYLSKNWVARKYTLGVHLNEVQTSTIQSIILVLYSLVTSWPFIGFSMNAPTSWEFLRFANSMIYF